MQLAKPHFRGSLNVTLPINADGYLDNPGATIDLSQFESGTYFLAALSYVSADGIFPSVNRSMGQDIMGAYVNDAGQFTEMRSAYTEVQVGAFATVVWDIDAPSQQFVFVVTNGELNNVEQQMSIDWSIAVIPPGGFDAAIIV